METNQEMSYMLKILPSTLKTQLAKFLYQEAILVNKFLNDRDDNFYSKYLEELKSQRFIIGDYLTRAGEHAVCVYFIMNGVARNLTTSRYFESGQMINHDAVFLKKPIQHDYVAETEMTVLYYDASTFEQILNQFPDCHEDINQIIKERRVQQLNQKFVKTALHD